MSARPLSRALLAPVLATLLASCNTPGFDAVSISPIYGWTGGCNTVRVSGHGFAEDATVTVGAVDLPIAARGEGIDAGYWVEGALPADPVRTAGYATVAVHSAGQTSTLPDAYYFVACPQNGNLESLDTETAVGGQAVAMRGCSLGADLTVRLTLRDGDGADAVQVPVTPTCGSTDATFTAPTLADGLYDVALVDTAGDVVFPPYPCPADPADTAGALLWCPTLTYGAAE